MIKAKELIIILILLSLSAQALTDLGVFKQNEVINLIQLCDNCTYNNITSIRLPKNHTIILGVESELTHFGVSEWNYTFCDTNELGMYSAFGYYNPHGDEENEYWWYTFEVTPNGYTPPSDNLIIFLSILFLLVLGIATFLTIYNLGHLIALDYDLIDVAFNWGIYFIFVGFYVLHSSYLGDPIINNILDVLLWLGGFMLIFIPLLAFILSITVGSILQKKVNSQLPRRKIRPWGL